MQKIDKKVTKVISYIRKMNGNSSDIVDRIIKIDNKKVAYVYLESVCSEDKISDFIMRSLSYDAKYKKNNLFENIFEYLKNTLYSSKYKIIDNYDELFTLIASGFTCVFVDGYDKSIVFETKATLDRGVSEPTSNSSIIGPKDSFTENHLINLGLIRKRIKDKNLYFEDMKIGRRTKTKVTIAYINDIAIKDKVAEVKNKLNEIDIDGILDSGYIKSFLIKQNQSTFPRIIAAERPDLVCGALLEGKIAILVENSPYVLVMPAILVNFFHSPEDYYQKSINASFTRFLRFIAFLLAVLGPGIYIALTTFNQELIPDQLLTSLAVQRSGVPFPTAIEIIIMIVSFEILKESDIRTPNPSGTAISIVGALILGEAAVNAGIVSPIVIIVVALTSICSLVFNDIEFISAIRWWRLGFMLFSATIGIVGFIVVLLLFMIKLCSIETLGVCYITPFSPFSKVGLQDSLIIKPRRDMKYRPSFLTNNIKRMGKKK